MVCKQTQINKHSVGGSVTRVIHTQSCAFVLFVLFGHSSSAHISGCVVDGSVARTVY